MSHHTGLLSVGLGAQMFEFRLQGHCERASGSETRSDKSRIYFIEQAGAAPAMKIGFTGKRSAASRLMDMQGGNPQQLAIMFEVPGSIQHEELLHCVLTPHWLRGEWFTLDRLSAGFLETMRANGLTAAMLEYAKGIHDVDHARLLRRVVKQTTAGPVHNMALTNWGKSRSTTFENKFTAKALNGAALGWVPRVIVS